MSLAPDGGLLIEGNVQLSGDLTVRNLVVLDEIKAPKVLAEKLNIKTGETDDAGKSKDSIGTAKIDAGQTEIVVETTAVTDKSKVFVTATTSTGSQSIYVSEQTDKEGFTVKLDQPLTTDVKFNWWVVN